MSTLDPPGWRPPPTTNQLIATVRAPAAALCAPDGQLRAGDLDGLFIADLRVLAEARLHFDGIDPHHLAHMHDGPGRTRFISVARAIGDPSNDPTVGVDRIREMTQDGMAERILTSSSASGPVRTTVVLALRGDPAPLGVAKQGPARPALPPVDAAATWTWGSDHVIEPAEAPGLDVSAVPARFRWSIEIEPGGHSTLEWFIRAT